MNLCRMPDAAWITLLLLCSAVLTVRSHTLDFGTCACSCRDSDKDGKGPVPFSGIKGDQGPPGKRGPPGPAAVQAEFETSPGTVGNPGTSCADLQRRGVKMDGVYHVKPNAFSTTFQVFCDMSTAGGAWTLVASVHENNARGSCTAGDRWSSEQGSVDYVHSAGNWENTNVFGDVLSATSDDYKNPAYFLLSAHNVMIWHVPNNTPASQYKQAAKLSCRTSNGFLQQYGGNLRSFYKDHFPMRVLNKKSTGSADINALIFAVRRQSQRITAQLPNWNNYNYDDANKQSIADGGNDIFDTGNMISFALGATGTFNKITYEEKYAFGGVQVNTSTGYPFFMFMWIDDAVENVRIKVDSNLGADGAGNIVSLRGSLQSRDGLFTLKYEAQHVFNSSDASVMQVHFIIYSRERWQSKVPEMQRTLWSNTTNDINQLLTLAGTSKKLLYGYTLFSKDNTKGGRRILNFEVDGAMQVFLDVVASNLPNVNDRHGCSLLNESLAVPVQFEKGSARDVMASIPPKVAKQVTPGFIHFRATGASGRPTAICSGFRSETCSTDTICVGSVNTPNINPKEPLPCGDYPNWRKRRTEDVGASLLLFYGE